MSETQIHKNETNVFCNNNISLYIICAVTDYMLVIILIAPSWRPKGSGDSVVGRWDGEGGGWVQRERADFHCRTLEMLYSWEQ